MLDMGFIRDIRKILNFLPKQRQNLMFSATFSDDIRVLAKTIVNNPVEVAVAAKNTTAERIEQWVYPVDKSKKTALLTHLIKDNEWQQVLVFSRTRHGANKITKQLEAKGIAAAAIHGNKSQGARTRALAEFKKGEVRVLVATDIAARGLDINQLPQVVNFDLPNVSEDYVHRIGRTGRAGAAGHAISLVSADEYSLLQDIERLIQTVIERKDIAGFEPQDKLQPSRLNSRSSAAKKPKKTNNSSGHRDGQRSGENARGHKPPAKSAAGQRPSNNANSANKGRRRRANPAS
jgi:ATP-dependent RNA helicase RhlE